MLAVRVDISVWQGCSDWQPLFIREYWLPMGHIAWQGFLQQGRGLVLCEVHASTATVDWSCTAVPYTARFVAAGAWAACCHDLSLLADQSPAVAEAIATYNPAQDAILLLIGDSHPYVSCLKGWAVPPPECSRQMGDSRSDPSRNRHAEFTVAPQL
ncbi:MULTISPECIES: hypothetical protein [Cyanophyceae]|uniref:hypothetical protein n=1 Tax=Cyanophyceae TaxID=3028117 RepID=UPI001681EF85|nr:MULTISPECIES: hypothetical protein [Cyanophyceae]MBD1915390.1 hypothetical protein [Phormidium sp. FACHB-77]MBD2032391.1 hypothetical protein [Phormidium sp. FACHB-322]MBD2052562.1 hypothetical protein [Leptolyngbya sp. FACHB-60]